ncbi:MAG: anthranilate phosphoribosyltransferase, partial [Pseudomonadota bacterium]|nr:anthranilate phosphoribosyltransferase [Pseudomonadota bacterium]
MSQKPVVFNQALDKIVDHQDLSFYEMQGVMQQLMSGEASESQIAALMVGLSMKGETVDELAAAAEVMQRLATPVDVSSKGVIDIVGTGGDGAKLFNVSTASSFVVAAAGVKVAKHGNYSVSSSSGSANVLEQMGVELGIRPAQVALCINELGIGFLFARNHHSAMRFAAPVRTALGLKSFFNLLGPMTNPVNTEYRLVGAYTRAFSELMANVMSKNGVRRLWCVHSDDGLDEISCSAPTTVTQIFDGEKSQFIISPETVGRDFADLDLLRVDTPEQSFHLIEKALQKGNESKEVQAARLIISLNAGAALFIAEQT